MSPIRRLLPRTELHVRELESVDLENRTITTSTRFHPHAHVIHYDHLVFALGNVTDFRGLRGLPEHAFPFKTLSDALTLRNHVIRALEEAAIEQQDDALRKRLLTFVVAGGGFSDVEVCAELNDFVRGVAAQYRGIDPKEIRVVLVHSQDRILPEMSEKLALFAQRILGERGVELLLNARLSAATGEAALLANGTVIATKTIVSTVPSSPHPLIEALALPRTKNGRIEVDATLAVKGSEHLWAVGDFAMVPAPGGGFAPPTAPHATRQAATTADNIVARMHGRALTTFAFEGLGKMGSLGHRSAVAEVFGINISGFPAWFLWRTIYPMKVPGWGRRVKIAASWTLDLFLPAELVQRRLGSSVGVTEEHFEAGQEVFREGDVGDRVYIILNGNADVLRGGGRSPRWMCSRCRSESSASSPRTCRSSDGASRRRARSAGAPRPRRRADRPTSGRVAIERLRKAKMKGGVGDVNRGEGGNQSHRLVTLRRAPRRVPGAPEPMSRISRCQSPLIVSSPGTLTGT